MVKQYGAKKGKQVFYSWVNKMGYDDTKPMPTKSFYFTDLELKSVDGEFYIEGIASSINKDLGNDTLTKECLQQMADIINSKNVKLGYDHTELLGGRPTLEAVGRLIEGKVQDGKLWVKGLLDKTFTHFNDIKEKIEKKFLDGLSIEYQVNPEKTLEDYKGSIRHRIIGGLKTLMGVALTPRPMNQDSYFDYFVKHLGAETKQVDDSKMSEKDIDNTKNKSEVKQMAEEEEQNKEETPVDAPKEKPEEKKDEEEPTEIKSVDFEKLGKEVYEKQQQEKKITEMKSYMKQILDTEMKKVPEPYLNPEEKFGQPKSPYDAELKHWRDVNKDNTVDVEVKYQAAAALHDKLHSFGITQRQSGTFRFKKPGQNFAVGGKAAQELEVKHFEYKAQLEHDTDKVADTDYYQNAAELNDVYDPVIVSHLNDKTTLWGLMKKKSVADQGGDRYGFRVWKSRIEGIGGSSSAYYYDEAATLAGYHATMLKCQIPFMQYGVTVQISGLMVAESRGSVGDLFAKQIQRATADLLRGINADLYGTSYGMTDGGAILGLEVIGDDAGTYAAIYGQDRATYTTLQGTDDAQSGTPNIDKPLLRKMKRTVEKNGANTSQLIYVCDQIQRDKMLGLLDPAQRINNTSPRAGFEGLPMFDGIPIHADDQCNDGYIYCLPMDSYYAAVLVAPTYEDLAKTDDSKKGFIKTYFAVLCENPNWVYKVTGLLTT